ncbi:hypothetical protein NKI48_03025 [Mesorhizobium sp. M0644]|uniref:hypothetical protein n=1 Tax=Mesorhizobium sp. M0644 TaxID=2956979 RepID=UPI003336D8A3
MISNRAVTAATLGLVLWLCGLAAMLAFGTFPAAPHEATPTAAMPQGWTYPFSCCSGYDCREVKDTDIVEGARGYEIRATGELIPMSDKKIKQSPDGRFHWCSVAGANDGKTICLFVPPRSF